MMDTHGLVGLVLAGGQSRRMGQDKGRIIIDGQTQVNRCMHLLRPLCSSVFVSVRKYQAVLELYRDMPLVLDDERFQGPAAGLLAAWAKFPSSALFVLAVDMPRVDAGTLRYLYEHRNTERMATAYCHAEGITEPLCTIWEAAAAKLLRTAPDAPAPSLRQVLENAQIESLACPEPRKLVGVNTPDALREVLSWRGP